jgi:hypothetical protein
MSLCIAWRDANNVLHISSDSRLSFSENNSIDLCPKIVRFPIKIYSPNMENEPSKLLYQFEYGFGFVGSFVTSFILKESIFDILNSLQCIPGITDISMENICNTIQKFFEIIAKDICEQLAKKGISEIIIIGFCPKDKKQKSYSLTIDASGYPLKTNLEEILHKPEVLFFGSGRKKAEEIFKESPDYHLLKILKLAINDDNTRTVGGGLQYGRMENNNFKIFGIQDYIVNDEQKNVNVFFHLRNIRLYQETLAFETDNYIYNQKFLLPFKSEIDEYIKKGYEIKSGAV